MVDSIKGNDVNTAFSSQQSQIKEATDKRYEIASKLYTDPGSQDLIEQSEAIHDGNISAHGFLNSSVITTQDMNFAHADSVAPTEDKSEVKSLDDALKNAKSVVMTDGQLVKDDAQHNSDSNTKSPQAST